ncbi:hypothetical protein [Bacteroides sp.]
MFWRKVEGKFIYTEDPILRMYKFTNVYKLQTGSVNISSKM